METKKYKYNFATEIVEIEISEEWRLILKDMDRENSSRERRQRRYEYHLDIENDKDEWNDIAGAIYQPIVGEEDDRAKEFIKLLNEEQLKLVKAIYEEGKSVNEVAAEKCVDHSAISHRLMLIREKISKKM